MPKHFQKPKKVVVASGILRNCRIQMMSGDVVYTDKTKKNKIILTSDQIALLTDSLDQRLSKRIDVRCSHVRIGRKEEWQLTMVRMTPEMTFDTI